MDLPTVGQAALIADEFARLLARYEPSSVCLLGCAGGNGLDRVPYTSVRRLVAADINPDYAATTLARYRDRIAGLEVVVADAESDGPAFQAVDLLYAALLFEYVDLRRALQFIRRHCQPGAILAALLQLPNEAIAEVTPSPYASLQELNTIMRLIAPAELRQRASEAGFRHQDSRSLAARGGKSFAVEVFQASSAASD